MDEEPAQVGTVPFNVPSIGTPCSTYYKIFGDLRSGHPPLLVLHGGPGSGHEYLLTFSKLWRRNKIPVILYDQIGCASSTHLREKAGDKAFWSAALFVKELENLIQSLHLGEADRAGFHILGHSWGGVLGSYCASRQPRGLRRLIIASSPAKPDHNPVYMRLCYKKLSQEAQNALEEATRSGDYSSQNFRDSYLEMRRTFWSRAEPFPAEELQPAISNQADDSTVASMMYGTNPFECNGALAGWNLIPELSRIKVPTLVYHGGSDFVVEEAIEPFLQNIPDVRRVTLANASHMAHVDNEEMQEKVLELVGTFLLEDGVSE